MGSDLQTRIVLLCIVESVSLFNATIRKLVFDMLFKMKNIPTEPTSAKAPAINHTLFLFSQIWASGVWDIRLTGGKSEYQHSTWLHCMTDPSSLQQQRERDVSCVVICCVWNEEWGLRRGVCVTAGVVLLWRTLRSSLPLWLVINGYRFITSSQSAMLPACPTLLITQSDWLMRTHKHTCSFHKPVQHWSKLLQLFRYCYDFSSALTNVLPLCLHPLHFLIPPSFLPSLFPEDIFILHGKDKKNPLIYGLFTTSRYIPL